MRLHIWDSTIWDNITWYDDKAYPVHPARPFSYVFAHATISISAIPRSLKCAIQTTLEQNKNTAMMTTDKRHDDLGGMLPENIDAHVRRL
jgi:hypothetical protein